MLTNLVLYLKAYGIPWWVPIPVAVLLLFVVYYWFVCWQDRRRMRKFKEKMARENAAKGQT
jgi:Flp pilus assembly protein TadB